MSKTPWTPGPWWVDAPDELQGLQFIPVLAGLGENVSDVYSLFDDEGVSLGITEQICANARLIAAAPEMAEVLADLVEALAYIERTYGSRINPPTLDNARALLARIHGDAT